MSGARVRHWVRPLKNGDIEWFMSADGHVVQGSGSREVHRMVCGRFKEWSDVKLPDPEFKAPRG